MFDQDGLAVVPGEYSGWKLQHSEEKKKSSREEIHSKESCLTYTNQVPQYTISSVLLRMINDNGNENPQESSRESYLSYSLADNQTDSR